MNRKIRVERENKITNIIDNAVQAKAFAYRVDNEWQLQNTSTLAGELADTIMEYLDSERAQTMEELVREQIEKWVVFTNQEDEEIDNAMRKIEYDKPFYANELYQKYLSAVSSAVLFQEELLQALKEDKIDFIFHFSQIPYAAEENGFILSNTVWSDIEEEAKEAGVTAFCEKSLFMSQLRDLLSNPVPKTETAKEKVVHYSGKSILLVEDNALNQEIAQTILEDAGFTIDTASDGMEAVPVCQRPPAIAAIHNNLTGLRCYASTAFHSWQPIPRLNTLLQKTDSVNPNWMETGCAVADNR